MKNITPSIAVMAVGLAGAFFVYNVYFKNDVNSTFSSIEPAAGEEVVAEDSMMDDAAEATEDAVEATEDMIDGEDNVVEEAAEETEEAVEEAGEEAEAAADEMHDEAKH